MLTDMHLNTISRGKGQMNRMIMGQGLAQIVSAFMGGMGGGARIGQTIVNSECGGYTRVSQGVNFFSLLLIMVCAAPIIGSIPLGAVVGSMFYVVSYWSTFSVYYSKRFLTTLSDSLFMAIG